MNKDDIMKNTAMLTAKAVAHDWETRTAQRQRQKESGRADQGSRSAVTGDCLCVKRCLQPSTD
jgi:hypothetical protein